MDSDVRAEGRGRSLRYGLVYLLNLYPLDEGSSENKNPQFFRRPQ
ncbi:hypothetical protein HMPREF1051_1543 [Neisseria sicca VK64]|uniref:Uncharacterized protein n=1 Tax=Neisseria sicca VK64 TaxID=1095748 RepID=I2NRD3_NEISI|nr:hypothetical protein HMPREF1051_1543 [Neisseria sicca VK64]